MKTELEKLLLEKVHLLWASRTDAGVHASANVVAFEAAARLPLDQLPDVLNSRLPGDLWVVGADATDLEWHPRYSARSREYHYRIWLEDEVPYDVRRYVYPSPGGWDERAAQHAMEHLRGTSDFAGFARSGGNTGTLCQLYTASQSRMGNEVRLVFTANRFLRRMVCNLAGVVIAAARGRIDPDVLARQQYTARTLKLKAAPPQGLVLMKVNYAGTPAGEATV